MTHSRREAACAQPCLMRQGKLHQGYGLFRWMSWPYSGLFISQAEAMAYCEAGHWFLNQIYVIKVSRQGSCMAAFCLPTFCFLPLLLSFTLFF